MLIPISALAGIFFALERLFPDQKLPKVKHWWWRAVLFNGLQIGIVVLSGLSWEHWFQRWSLISLADQSMVLQAAAGYLLSTFVYYWWHRFRHSSNTLWLLCHQLHHSPSRIETITAFYKHPVELLANSMVSATINYMLLGLSVEGAAWVTALSALAEFFYHVNVTTPQWIGLFIQRPEMHRIHHQRGKHTSNFGDVPIWDILFGTYRNPRKFDGLCGYKPEREQKLWEMLTFRNVNGPVPRPWKVDVSG